jgi:hypothetical protein
MSGGGSILAHQLRLGGTCDSTASPQAFSAIRLVSKSSPEREHALSATGKHNHR